MIRQQLIEHGIRGDRLFRWRGEDVSRVEGLSDAVFAFAVTLLVVSLEVPGTYADLMRAMQGFLAFGLCFAILIWIWHCHYIFFRRYAIRDLPIVALNAVLLFVVLFYIYPLKFLFTFLIDVALGVATPRETIGGGNMAALMVIYSVGVLTIFGIFLVMFLYAYRKREQLRLDKVELALTRQSIQAHVIHVAVAAVSILIASIGGLSWAPVAGFVYVVIGPARAVHGSVTGSRIERLAREAR